MQKITIVEDKLYGRLKSRGLTVRQQVLFNVLFPEVSITHYDEVDSTVYKNIFLEIGFGSGEHLSQLAIDNKSSLFIGCEPFVNGVASLLTKIDDLKISNIRILQGDARKLIGELPKGSLSGAFLLFPDPWPKRKHIRRRFLQEKTITAIYERLKIGGIFRIATDHDDYRKWVLKLFSMEKFKGLFHAETYDKSTRPSEDVWPMTRYEQKAINEILYVEYTKLK